MSGRKVRKLLRALLPKGRVQVWCNRGAVREGLKPYYCVTYRHKGNVGLVQGVCAYDAADSSYEAALRKLVTTLGNFEGAVYDRMASRPRRYVNTMDTIFSKKEASNG